MHSNRIGLNFIAGFCLTVLSFAACAATTGDLPPSVQLVGRDDPAATAEVLGRRPVFLLVSSHATADLLKAVPAAWLDQGWTIPADQFVAVAAVSKAPWLVKKLFIGSGLRKLVAERTELLGDRLPGIGDSPVIVDMEGDMVAALRLGDFGKTEYAVFIIDKAGEIRSLIRSELADDSEAGINAAARKIVQAAAPHLGTKP